VNFERQNLEDIELISLYKALLKPRMIEEKMLILLRQGKISKWFSGIGQEAISVGVTSALNEEEYILPMHRNLGVFTTRNIPFAKLFKQWQGKKGGFTKGRDRSFHFGTNEFHIVGMISHLGPQLNVGDGIALASKLKNEKKVTVAFSGEGATSEGDFHEALNIAAVWDLPIIFVIENNGYGLSTPTKEQFRARKISDKGIGYGMNALTIDGNNILEVYQTVKKWAERIRENPQPLLLECNTFRMRGHEEASGVKYVPKELMEEWGQKDPIENFQEYLIQLGLLNENKIADIKKEIKLAIDNGLIEANAEPAVEVNHLEEMQDVFQAFEQRVIPPFYETTVEKRMVDAIAEGLYQSMEKYGNLVIMGQDIAEYGGAFKITDGFLKKFGKDRVRNTPICESGILSAALGMSIKNMKTVVEMQFADFVTSGFNPIINNLAKTHYRWGQNVDVVIRMPTGAGVGAGPFHSQSNEAWFTHTPGLKVVYPSNPEDAKGLLNAAIEDPNPVLFFEHKALYRSVSGPVSEEYYTKVIGEAALAKEGEDISVITYGMGVHWALKYQEENPNISLDILDLRTLMPLDYKAIEKTVKNTGKVIILHEDVMFGGIGADISAWINENLFEKLDAPVKRVASLDTPIPFAASLEDNFLPVSRFAAAVEELNNY
jgi:2-oxoisovalerate dehydrogenase E1 component